MYHFIEYTPNLNFNIDTMWSAYYNGSTAFPRWEAGEFYSVVKPLNSGCMKGTPFIMRDVYQLNFNYNPINFV